MADTHPAVAAILAETNELIPTRHYDQCEAMTALGRATWMPCRCRERQAGHQAVNLLRWLAGREDANGPLCCCTACLPDIIDEIEASTTHTEETDHA